MPAQLSRPIRAIGVLTGGGDVLGLNAAIKALVYRAEPLGIRVMGLRLGWEGITFLDRTRKQEDLIFSNERPETWRKNYLVPLNRLNTRTIDRQGGTILQSTRTNPARTRVGELPPHLAAYGIGHAPDERIDLTDEVLANLALLELDGLVVIGGDDTLSYGATLTAKGVPVWGIPKTMDNDVPEPTTVLASKRQSVGRRSLSIAFALRLVRIVKPFSFACLGAMPVSPSSKPLL